LFGDAGVPLAFTPWGILVEEQGGLHVLRWAAVRRVHLHVIYGRDEATPGALWSIVTVETQRERYTARAPGAVPLESVLANLDAYADESSHRIAMDLDGTNQGDGPIEPDFEPLITAARAYVESAPASSRLSLPSLSYRRQSAHAAGSETVSELRRILLDRTPHPVDPRPFAAVLAAELHAEELLRDIVKLVQSPHPFVAGVAKAAAHKIGAEGSDKSRSESARAGSLDEVAPFLHEDDVTAMSRWSAARLG
jgi:hypothetical protein